MKVKVSFVDTKFKKEDQSLINKFIKFLQSEYPLREDVIIKFMGQRSGKMSTGARTENSEIKVLAKNRLNRDIMRTLSHEWVHEHQRKVLNRDHGPDIGGQNEDEANAFAGQLVKKFEKNYPNLEPKMYENFLFNKKLNLLSEQILIKEKEEVGKHMFYEMKKIGIEKLPYSYSSLQRFIDSKTMDVHYNKHYKGYVDKLNKALENNKGDVDLEEIIKSISKFDDKVRNNAGGAFNHALFWKMLSPKKQLPKGEILKKITSEYGNIKHMKDEFNETAKERFGSGWVWLYLTKDDKLKIMSTANQDNPLMNVIKGGGYPILGLDVWEHAYYLKYQNKRDEYIKKFWDVVNWEFVNDLYLTKTKKNKTKIIKESQTSNEDVIEFTYDNIQPLVKIVPRATIKRFYFNDIQLVSGDRKTATKVLFKGDKGDFEFDIKKDKVSFKDGNASVLQKTMFSIYPNFDSVDQNTNLNRVGITSKNVIDSLKKAFPNNWFPEDSVYTEGLRGVYPIGDKLNDPKEDWSIMNFFDSKSEIKNLIYNRMEKDLQSNIDIPDIVDWMSDLFKNDANFTQKLVDRQWRSVRKGFELEKQTIEYLVNLLGPKKIITYPFGSKMDRWTGVDVTIDGVNYQVKPLSKYEIEKDNTEFVVYTYNMKNYQNFKQINKIIFANKDQILIFDNENYRVPSGSVGVFYKEPIIYQK